MACEFIPARLANAPKILNIEERLYGAAGHISATAMPAATSYALWLRLGLLLKLGDERRAVTGMAGGSAEHETRSVQRDGHLFAFSLKPLGHIISARP
jgi:hypothetical protein